MQVCERCGAWSPENARRCGSCRAEPVVTTLAGHSEPRAVQVRLTFTCRGCGLQAPLDGLPDQEAVTCCRCGLRQVLPRERLTSFLAHAWGVADLWHDDPEGGRAGPVAVGAVNPYRAPSSAGAMFEGDKAPAQDLAAWLARGVPLDDLGGGPVLVDVVERGTVRTSAGHTYQLPPETLSLCPGLVGAIADDHEVEGEALDLAAAETGEAFVCVRCGAALPVDGTERLVRCGYCDAVHRVPAELRHQLLEDPVPATWWLFFDGPSPLRRRLQADPPLHLPIEPLEDAARSLPRKAMDVLIWLGLPTALLLGSGLLWRLGRFAVEVADHGLR